MATFEANKHAEAVVLAPQADIWAALVDPDLMARFTPFLTSITADGDHWLWQMTGIKVAGRNVAPSFTEQMVFAEPDRIDFHHDAPAGSKEWAGVEGWYALSPAEGDQSAGDQGAGDQGAGGPATLLVTDLTISLELPVPRAAGGAVRATMRKVIDTMGDRFSANLLAHLHAEQRPL